MLSCYFPLVFTPRPGDPDSVSRDTLADALLAALTAAPAFAPMFVPLALEKLTSTLKCDVSLCRLIYRQCTASMGSMLLPSG